MRCTHTITDIYTHGWQTMYGHIHFVTNALKFTIYFGPLYHESINYWLANNMVRSFSFTSSSYSLSSSSSSSSSAYLVRSGIPIWTDNQLFTYTQDTHTRWEKTTRNELSNLFLFLDKNQKENHINYKIMNFLSYLFFKVAINNYQWKNNVKILRFFQII